MSAEAGGDRPLSGRVAVVTGASSGIGRASARLLAAAGAAVALGARRSELLEELASEIESAGGRALVAPTDVTVRAQVEALVERARAAFDRVDILVNNAGIMPSSALAALRVDDWDRMIDVNVKGVLYGVAAVLPVMLAQGGGHIVNIGSLAGRRPLPGITVYAATKFAVRAISAGVQRELSASRKIRVTDVEPGVVETELPQQITDAAAREAFLKRWRELRMLQAEDVARAVLYAVSQPEHVNVNEILMRPTDQET